MGQQKFRHEIKYFINMMDYYAMRNRIRHIAVPDPFASQDGTYLIRSLYFDNHENKALMEKLNGIGNREKFRIRYYNNDPSLIKLEKKSKHNNLCTKNATGLSREECEKLISGDTAWMPESGNPMLIELYTKMRSHLLRPKTVVEYTREAYLYKPGNVRVTIDRNLRSGLFSKDFLNPGLPTVGMSSDTQIILEIKYDAFLPEIIRDIVQTNERRSTAISKYAACRMFG